MFYEIFLSYGGHFHSCINGYRKGGDANGREKGDLRRYIYRVAAGIATPGPSRFLTHIVRNRRIPPAGALDCPGSAITLNPLPTPLAFRCGSTPPRSRATLASSAPKNGNPLSMWAAKARQWALVALCDWRHRPSGDPVAITWMTNRLDL